MDLTQNLIDIYSYMVQMVGLICLVQGLILLNKPHSSDNKKSVLPYVLIIISGVLIATPDNPDNSPEVVQPHSIQCVGKYVTPETQYRSGEK